MFSSGQSDVFGLRENDVPFSFNILTSDVVQCPRKENICICICVREIPNAKQTE